MSRKPASGHPQWATAHKKPGTELRLINGRYYLYDYKTVYDAARKKPKKVSGALLGSVTEKDGFVPSAKRTVQANKNLAVSQPVLVKEYGASQLVLVRFAQYAKKLEAYFEDTWKEMLAVAYCRFVYHCPLKNIPYRLDSSYLPQSLGLQPFTDKTASAILNKTGGRTEAMQGYMKSFITAGDYILMDGTNITSKSEYIPAAKRGYNKQLSFDPQVNLLYIYSATQRMPVFYRLLPGNIQDVRAFKNTLLAAGLAQAIVVADKGFYSKANVELLLEEKLSFIIPLKRDSALIDYTALADNTFKAKAGFFPYEKRIIWHRCFEQGQRNVHLFLDDSLKLKEETDYLNRTKSKPEEYNLEKYHGHRNSFGTIALVTGKEMADSKDVYETYKSRMYIETMFDGMKNVLEADHTYMQDQQTLEGWMFINHVCLQWYQELYIELKQKELLKKYSVNDYIQLLTDVKKVKINGQWHLNEFTKATAKLIGAAAIKI